MLSHLMLARQRIAVSSNYYRPYHLDIEQGTPVPSQRIA